MSLRRLYSSLPVQARQCTWCHEPILRNIDQDKDGRLYHHGCLLTARETHYECLECFSSFNGTESSFEEECRPEGEDFKFHRKSLCPHCGSSNVKGLSQVGVIET